MGEKLEIIEHCGVIKNDICGEILVNYLEKSGFNFFCLNIEKLPYINYQVKKEVLRKHPEQNNIFKPTQKKIDFEINRLERIYNEALLLSNEKVKTVEEFYSKIELLGGIHKKHKNSGWIDFEHYELQYTIYESGYIEQKIRLKYQGQAIDFLLTQK